jgi:hypothetical protein
VRAWHGTSAEVEQSIRLNGLVEPWQGRGVYVSPSRRYARSMSRFAAAQERHRQRRKEHAWEVIVVEIELDGLNVSAVSGLLAHWEQVVPYVPPDAIVDIKTELIILPAADAPFTAMMRTRGIGRGGIDPWKAGRLQAARASQSNNNDAQQAGR